MNINRIARLVNEDIDYRAGILVESEDDGMVYADQLEEEHDFALNAVLMVIGDINNKTVSELRAIGVNDQNAGMQGRHIIEDMIYNIRSYFVSIESRWPGYQPDSILAGDRRDDPSYYSYLHNHRAWVKNISADRSYVKRYPNGIRLVKAAIDIFDDWVETTFTIYSRLCDHYESEQQRVKELNSRKANDTKHD